MSAMTNNTASQKIRTYGFHGGIHPPENKDQSNQTPIEKAPIPPRLYLPLQQHIGKPAKAIVEAGQHVLKGQLLAEAQGAVSVAVHAPTSGTVEAITEHAIAHPSGMTDQCIVLASDGEDTWCELSPCEDYKTLEATDIRARIRAAGIAGMGGAGFPTEVKLHPPHHDKVSTLILNAAECEPYITADDRLMRERADEVIKGMEIMAYVLEPGECIIGIEDNKPEAIAALQQAAEGTRIQVTVIPTKYPSGGEKQLIKILTDKEVPSGKIPADIGVMCQNVGTATAVYRAVRFGEPLISRITTLTGEQIARKGNVEVLLGTPIDWLLAKYGYQADKPERLIMGGPMMGFILSNADTPIVKTTNCILAPSRQELPLDSHEQACIRCGLCAEACPAELLPQQLFWFSRAQEFEKAEHHNLFDCIECGACSYVCPSSIPLVHYYRHAKGEIRQQRLETKKSDLARIRFEARQERLEREAAEKEAKRKARAEAAAKAQAVKKAAQANEPTATENVDAKKLAVEAALARKAVNNAQHDVAAQDSESFKLAWEKAQSKLDKMIDALDSARENNPEQVDKLKRAVEKNQMRVNQAKQLYEKSLGSSTEDTQPKQEATEASEQTQVHVTPADIEALELALTKAEAKLEKMQATLADAEQEQSDTQDKLKRAVEKNKTRVDMARKALEDAKSTLAAGEQS